MEITKTPAKSNQALMAVSSSDVETDHQMINAFEFSEGDRVTSGTREGTVVQVIPNGDWDSWGTSHWDGIVSVSWDH